MDLQVEIPTAVQVLFQSKLGTPFQHVPHQRLAGRLDVYQDTDGLPAKLCGPVHHVTVDPFNGTGIAHACYAYPGYQQYLGDVTVHPAMEVACHSLAATIVQSCAEIDRSQGLALKICAICHADCPHPCRLEHLGDIDMEQGIAPEDYLRCYVQRLPRELPGQMLARQYGLAVITKDDGSIIAHGMPSVLLRYPTKLMAA